MIVVGCPSYEMVLHLRGQSQVPMAESQTPALLEGAMEIGRPYTRLIRRLESIVALSDESRQLISQLPMSVRSFKANQDIMREGDVPTQCCLVLDGFLCRHKIASGSKRQIISFHISGDMPDLYSLHLGMQSNGTLKP
jgi:CRP-like cAMP-binding protein